MKIFSALFLLYFLFFSCKKEDTFDYRTKYEGRYNFSIHHSEYMFSYGIFFDTSYTKEGFIRICSNENDSLMEIHYGIDTFGIINSMGNETVISECSAFKISADGSMRFPLDMGSSLMYDGKFTGTDTIEMYIRFGGLGAWSIREIKGTKIK